MVKYLGLSNLFLELKLPELKVCTSQEKTLLSFSNIKFKHTTGFLFMSMNAKTFVMKFMLNGNLPSVEQTMSGLFPIVLFFNYNVSISSLSFSGISHCVIYF